MAVKDTVMSIKATGKPVVPDELVAVLLLWNLRPGPESRHLRQLVERSCAVAPEEGDEPMLQLNLVMGELLQEPRIQEQEDKRDAGGKALKFGANTTPYQHGGGPHFSKGQQRGGGGSSGGSGDYKRKAVDQQRHGQGGQTWQRRPELQNKQTTPGTHCTICHLRNHVTSRCLKGPYPPCPHCQRTNHPEQDCRAKKENGESANKRFKLLNVDGPKGPGPKGPNKWVMNMAICGSTNANVNKSVTEMYIDSAASKTMIGNRESLHNFTETEKEPITCAAGQTLFTEGNGKLKFVARKGIDLEEIDNVTYVPGLTSNLLSVHSISKSGYVTLFRNDTCEIYEPQNITIVGNPLLVTTEQNGSYKLKLETEPANVALKTSGNQSPINILHRRLAHLGKDNLDLLINKKLVDGIPARQDTASNCDVCLKSRQTIE